MGGCCGKGRGKARPGGLAGGGSALHSSAAPTASAALSASTAAPASASTAPSPSTAPAPASVAAPSEPPSSSHSASGASDSAWSPPPGDPAAYYWCNVNRAGSPLPPGLLGDLSAKSSLPAPSAFPAPPGNSAASTIPASRISPDTTHPTLGLAALPGASGRQCIAPTNRDLL